MKIVQNVGNGTVHFAMKSLLRRIIRASRAWFSVVPAEEGFTFHAKVYNKDGLVLITMNVDIKDWTASRLQVVGELKSERRIGKAYPYRNER